MEVFNFFSKFWISPQFAIDQPTQANLGILKCYIFYLLLKLENYNKTVIFSWVLKEENFHGIPCIHIEKPTPKKCMCVRSF